VCLCSCFKSMLLIAWCHMLSFARLSHFNKVYLLTYCVGSSISAVERGRWAVLTERDTGDVAAAVTTSRSSDWHCLCRQLGVVECWWQQGWRSCGDWQSTSQVFKIIARTPWWRPERYYVRPTAVLHIHYQGTVCVKRIFLRLIAGNCSL